MPEFKPELIIGVVVFIILIAAFAPVIYENVAVANDQRACTNEAYPYECLDNDDGLLNWCSNETDGTLRCLNASIPILNVSTSLCTNASGVRVVNASAISVCDSTGWADGIVAYEDVGLTPVETTLLGLVALFIVLSVVIFAIRGIKTNK